MTRRRRAGEVRDDTTLMQTKMDGVQTGHWLEGEKQRILTHMMDQIQDGFAILEAHSIYVPEMGEEKGATGGIALSAHVEHPRQSSKGEGYGELHANLCRDIV